MASLLSSVGHGLGSAVEAGDGVRVCGWVFCLDYTWAVATDAWLLPRGWKERGAWERPRPEPD